MEIESWWLLAVPLFFGLGWFAARVDLRNADQPRGNLPEAYFRGLNFLLNEQHDKAIDAFIDVVRVDPETVELHFALGNLFRRRGETDRAIRVHQNLAERSGLDSAQREHAVYELGQDYLKAGLLDRAEEAFNRLAGSRHAAGALGYQLEIAQMVRDWPLAIERARRLEREGGERRDRDIAHFHCELAAIAMAADTAEGGETAQRETAHREIADAAKASPQHPRPMLLAGELAIVQAQPALAIEAWRRLTGHNAPYLALVAEGWLAAHDAVGRAEEGVAVLEHAHREHPSVDTLAAIAAALVRVRGRDQAIAWTRTELERNPSLLGLEQLLSLGESVADDERRSEIEFIRRLIQPQARRLSRYVCRHCGFKARHFYWQCPGCSQWDTYAPKRTEEIER